MAPYFSVPSGGPGSEQRIYQDDWPAPAPDQSPECDDLSTVTGSQTPLGDEAPEGFVPSPERARSDIEPTSEGKDQQQDEGQEDEPSLAKLASQLEEVASSLEAMANAVPPDATVDIQDLLPAHSSPYGDAPAIEAVLEPTLQIPPRKDPELLPSAPPQCMLDQALQNQSLEQEQDSELPKHEMSLDQPGSSTDRREERAKATHRAHLEVWELPMLDMDARWEKVRQQPNLPKPTSVDAEVQKDAEGCKVGQIPHPRTVQHGRRGHSHCDVPR